MRVREDYSLLARLLLPLGLLLVPAVLFWNAFTLQGIFYYGDVVGQFFPVKAAFGRALDAGQIPLWTPNLMAGYPLHAEGEGGFLYPPSIILSALISATAALNYQLLLHLAIAGLGTYVYCRVLRLDPLSAAVGGLLFMTSGFMIAHLNHLSIISAAVWLPWLFAIAEAMVRRPRMGPFAALLGLVIGLQFYAGHAQVSFLSLLGIGLYVVYRAGAEFVDGQGLGRPISLLLAYGLAAVIGAGVAAPQLLATYELTDLSVRAGGVTGEFFTSFSLPPPYIATFLVPFFNGNPLGSTTPATAVEWCGYAGVFTLVAGAYAVLFRRDRFTLFFLLLAVVALALALGQWNPLYDQLAEVPVFNFFRVPARYIFLYTFALAVLAALGFQRLLNPGLPLAGEIPRPVTALMGLGTLVLGGWALATAGDLPRLIELWQVLPWALLGLSLVVIVARGRLLLGYRSFVVLALLLVVVDLYAFVAVFGDTFNSTSPADLLVKQPGVVAVLDKEESPYRVYTYERIYPAAEGVRESLAWNFSLASGLPSLGGYLPLTLDAYSEYAKKLPDAPRLADLANVKYVLVPQTIQDDETNARENLTNPFSPSPVGKKIAIPPTQVASIEVESSLSHSVDLTDGTVVADIVVSDGATTKTLPLRAGIDTAEWSYDRPDVRPQVKHSRPTVVRQYPAQTSYPSQDHLGSTYGAKLDLGQTMTVSAVEIVPHHPQGYIQVDRVVLVDANGTRTPLSHLAGYGDYEIAYRGNAAVAYRNRDVLPRFQIVHATREADTPEAAWEQLLAREFDPTKEVVLGPAPTPGRLEKLLARSPLGGAVYSEAAEGAPADADATRVVAYGSQSLTVQANLKTAGYLVVSDTFYPGWQAYVDGKQVPILRANWMFRALALPAGAHTVEMRYEPPSQAAGWLLSVLALLATGVVASVVPFARTIDSTSWRSA